MSTFDGSKTASKTTWISLASNPSSKTLVVGPSWVGDMVMAQALFCHLKLEDPHATIDVLAPGWSLPIVARMPQVNAGIASHVGHREIALGVRRKVAAQLQSRRYDRAIVLPRSLKAALIPWFAKIPRRTGFRGEWRYGLINDMRPFDRTVLDQTVKRFVALGVPAGALLPEVPQPALQVSAENQQRLRDHLALDCSRPVIAMMPGAEYGPAKCWPLEHFSELARLLEKDGKAVWILGSAKDRPAGDSIANASHARNLCGETDLVDVVDILALCDSAISNDSGLMHIAAAVGIHVHAIYGSSSPSFTPPLTRQSTIHHLALECSPCFERECPLQHLRCLREILPAEIFRAIA